MSVCLSLKHSDSSLETWGEVEAEVKKYFEEALLSEAFVDRRTYAIPQSTVSSLSTAFTSLEKREHNCKNYSCYVSSL